MSNSEPQQRKDTSGDDALTLTAVLQQVDDPTQRIVLKPPRVVIGRGASLQHDIAIASHDGKASRRHARLVFDAGVWILEDTSLNGTKVNGNKLLNQLVVLSDGDYIQIGTTFRFVFKNLDMTDLSDSRTGEWNSGDINALIDSQADAEALLQADDAEFEPPPPLGLFVSSRGYAYRDGALLPERITRSEHRLLGFLFALEGRAGDFSSISKAVWGHECSEQQVLALVRRLWRKIELNPNAPRYIFVQPGAGVALLPKGL